MAKNISVQEAASRLQNAGISFSSRYQKGTAGKGSKWVTGAEAAAPNYQAGIQEALSKGSYAKGVQNAGGSAYDQGIARKGVTNWGTGMQVSGDKYAKNVAPFASLWNSPLSTPRGARRSPANLQRMSQNVERFIKAKTS